MWDLDTHLATRNLERDLKLHERREPWAWPWRRARSLTFEYCDRAAARQWRRFAGARESPPAGPVVLARLDGVPLLALSVDGSTVVGPAGGCAEELVAALRSAASWLGREE